MVESSYVVQLEYLAAMPFALGVLVKYFDMDFYDAWELVKQRVPRAYINPSHISKLKKLFNVTLP